jgi:hypothetical protein
VRCIALSQENIRACHDWTMSCARFLRENCWAMPIPPGQKRNITRTFVSENGLHHGLEHGVQDLAGLLGIAVGKELHGALEIGEQHGDLLAVAL